jgi:TonB family protein
MELVGRKSQALLFVWLVLGLLNSGLILASGPKVNKKKLQRAVMHFSRARTLEEQGQLEEAVAEYRAALKEDPDEPYWYQTLGAALEKEGNSQEALEAYSRATQLSPDDSGLTSGLQDFQRRIAAGTSTRQTQNSPVATPRFKSGPHMSPPRAVYAPDPSYSDKARLIKYSGVVVLMIDVDAQGNVREVRDAKPLGLGLDERAIEVVRTWRFEPALRDGTPVATQIAVEVSFNIM